MTTFNQTQNLSSSYYAEICALACAKRDQFSTNRIDNQKADSRLFSDQKARSIWTKCLDFIVPQNEVTKRRELSFLPISFEKFIGNLQYKALINRFNGASSKEEYNTLVHSIWNDLVQNVRRDLNWEITVVKSQVVNACALPGGKIVINEGLINHIIDYLNKEALMQCHREAPEDINAFTNDFIASRLVPMLATVVGHEIAHADIGHGKQSIQKLVLFYLLIGLAYIITYLLCLGAKQTAQKNNDHQTQNNISILEKLANAIYKFLGKIALNLYMLAESRSNEFEADEMSLRIYMQEAGYDPKQASHVFDMFDKMHPQHAHPKWMQTIQNWLSTHPTGEQRKERAEEITKELNQPGILVPIAQKV